MKMHKMVKNKIMFYFPQPKMLIKCVHLKQKLLSASANALKLCLTSLPPNTSFDTIHNLTKRGTPTQMSDYKHAVQLFKLHNSNAYQMIGSHLTFNSTSMGEMKIFKSTPFQSTKLEEISLLLNLKI